MQVGVTVPIVEFGADLGAIRDYVQAAEHREAGLEQTVLMATTQAARA